MLNWPQIPNKPGSQQAHKNKPILQVLQSYRQLRSDTHDG